MYEDFDRCPHGYIPATCAECRIHAAAQGGDDPIGERFERFMAKHKDGQRPGWLTRRTEITAELAQLEGYARRSKAQDDQMDELVGELTVLGSLIDQDDVAVRSAAIARGMELMKDPANLERPIGAPALVKDARHDRIETPAESLQRMRSNPWRDGDGGPLGNRMDSAAGLVSRCHTALDGMEGQLTRDGAQMLGNLISERPSTFGPYELRSGEDVRRSAAWVLALSNPAYRTAFEKILRQPEVFRTGAGVLLWDDDERQAFTDVIYRAALIENTATGGTYWLPLMLDPVVILTNAGAASPWRGFCRTVQTTSNTWNGVASAGVTAQWLAEGATSADATPTITQLQIPVWKQAAWVMASYELEEDQPGVAASVPMLIADAKERLEEIAFVTGNGTSAPAGTVTRATVDGNVAVLTTANAPGVFSLLANLPVRFRVGDQARPRWIANIAVINALRAITPFTAATQAIVNDQTSDGIPEMLSIDFLESTTMDGVLTTGGHKGLLLMDGNSYLIVDRIGTQMIYEPLVASAGGIMPSGTSGWFAWSRTGADVATATALRVHSTT